MTIAGNEVVLERGEYAITKDHSGIYTLYRKVPCRFGGKREEYWKHWGTSNTLKDAVNYIKKVSK